MYCISNRRTNKQTDPQTANLISPITMEDNEQIVRFLVLTLLLLIMVFVCQWFGGAVRVTLPPGGLEANCHAIPSTSDTRYQLQPNRQC